MKSCFCKVICCEFIFLLSQVCAQDTVPVVFIHKGNSHYLQHSLWQAKQYNERVILIGDHSNSGYSGVEHYNMNDYSEEAAYFAKIYKHIGGTSYNYELFCFQRWFILKSFIVDISLILFF